RTPPRGRAPDGEDHGRSAGGDLEGREDPGDGRADRPALGHYRGARGVPENQVEAGRRVMLKHDPHGMVGGTGPGAAVLAARAPRPDRAVDKPGRRAGHLRGFGTVYQRGRIWWISYWWRGEQKRESSGSVKRGDAERLLKRRLQELGRGRFIDPKAEER